MRVEVRGWRFTAIQRNTGYPFRIIIAQCLIREEETSHLNAIRTRPTF